MTEIRTTAVEPTDTQPWRVRVRIDGGAARLTDLPNPGADPIDRHAEAALQVSGLTAIHRVRETERGYVWADGYATETGVPTYAMTSNGAEETSK